jgi:hypothetical protein
MNRDFSDLSKLHLISTFLLKKDMGRDIEQIAPGTNAFSCHLRESQREPERVRESQREPERERERERERETERERERERQRQWIGRRMVLL